MADENEPFDSSKKRRIDAVLVPDLDDAVLRIARMRKAQVLKCKCEARNIVTNTVKYYSNVTVECEPVDTISLQGLDKYGPIDFSAIQNMSGFSKEMTSCLTELNDVKKSNEIATSMMGQRKFHPRRFLRLKSHLIPGCH